MNGLRRHGKIRHFDVIGDGARTKKARIAAGLARIPDGGTYSAATFLGVTAAL